MLSSFFGQDEVKQNLTILIESSRNSVFPHTLFTGGAGLGKSSLARCIAKELGRKFSEVNSAYTGSSTETKLKLMIALEDVKENDIIFIDEIHGLNKGVQEMLYTAMEDNYINYGDIFGFKKKIPEFTLIGATTELHGLTNAMQGRFQHIIYLRDYRDNEIAQILQSEMGAGADRLAPYCRGNPRQAKAYADWVLRYCKVKKLNINDGAVEEAMLALGISKSGLTQDDIRYLELLKAKRIVGVRAISHTLNIEEKTVKNKIEPYLMKLGLISILNNSGKRTINIERYELLC